MSDSTPGPIVVTGANGFVGSRVCRVIAQRGGAVRAVVRRAGAAPDLPGVEEWVGEFGDPQFAADVLAGAAAAVTTVHPMGSDADTQRRVGVEATATFAHAAAEAGVERLVHVSTAAVYDRSPESGDVDEDSPLVGDDANAYAVTKRDTDAALAAIDGPTRVLLRPPAILGPGETSVWNSLRPAGVREQPTEPMSVPDGTFAWVHVDDLVTLIADVATGQVATSDDASSGPVPSGCTVVNVASSEAATQRDYWTTVADALGVDPVWHDGPAWTGRIVADRARGWGWSTQVSRDEALAEIAAGLR